MFKKLNENNNNNKISSSLVTYQIRNNLQYYEFINNFNFLDFANCSVSDLAGVLKHVSHVVLEQFEAIRKSEETYLELDLSGDWR